MSGFFENVVFPDDGGGIHVIRADISVVPVKQAGLVLSAGGFAAAQREALANLLHSLKDRYAEVQRRNADGHQREIVLTQIDGKAVDQDSFSLAFSFAHHAALHVDMDSLARHDAGSASDLRRLVALTGSLDATGAVRPVAGLAKKIAAIAEYAHERSVQDKVFVLPKANVDENRDGLASALKQLEADGWRVVPTSHMDDLVEFYTSGGTSDDTENEPKGPVGEFWRPVVVGLVVGTVAVAVVATRTSDAPEAAQSKPAEVEEPARFEARYTGSLRVQVHRIEPDGSDTVALPPGFPFDLENDIVRLGMTHQGETKSIVLVRADAETGVVAVRELAPGAAEKSKPLSLSATLGADRRLTIQALDCASESCDTARAALLGSSVNEEPRPLDFGAQFTGSTPVALHFPARQ